MGYRSSPCSLEDKIASAFEIEAKMNPEDHNAHPYWSLKIIPVYKKVINLK
jgi:hypothetical protein